MNYAYAAAETTAHQVNTSVWNAILSASPVVQLTLLLLIVLSVMCWAVMWSKLQQFKVIRQANEPFKNRFFKSTSLEKVYDDLDHYPNSSLARVFRDGYIELQKIADSPLLKNQPEDGEAPVLSGIDNIERVLRNSIDREIERLEAHLTILATTGATGPFIGLFGTVWGIMDSFHKIGVTGSASLAVVAPGISEALVATAIGLAAAIPAVVAYNHWISQIRRQEIELNNFTTDFTNIVKRNFFRGE